VGSWLQAIILGIVEGVTEFLPISSTGHLIIASRVLGFQDTGGAFEIGIQFGAVLAVLWYYGKDLVAQAFMVTRDPGVQRFWLAILLAFIPAGIVGFLLADYVTRYLFSPVVVALSLIVGGIVLWVLESIPRKPLAMRLEKVTLKQALIVGLAQVAALIPGVSRSGATIVGGMLAGMDRRTATAFSFYLSLPTLGIATLYAMTRSLGALDQGIFIDMAVALVVSFVTALISIHWLLRYVSHHSFKGFAVYRILAGAVILLVAAL